MNYFYRLLARFCFALLALSSALAQGADGYPPPTGILTKLANGKPHDFIVYDDVLATMFNLPAENKVKFDASIHGLVVKLSYDPEYKIYECAFIVYLDKEKSGLKLPGESFSLEDIGIGDTQLFPFWHFPNARITAEMASMDSARYRKLAIPIMTGGRGLPGNRFPRDAFDTSPTEKFLSEPLPGISLVKSSAQCEWFAPGKNDRSRIMLPRDWSKPYLEAGREFVVDFKNTIVISVPDTLSQQMAPYLSAIYAE